MTTERELDHQIEEALYQVRDGLRDPTTGSAGIIVWNAYGMEIGNVTEAARTCDLLAIHQAVKEMGKVEEMVFREGPPLLANFLGTDKQKAFFHGMAEVNRLLAKRNKLILESGCGCSLK
jgi:hypothetical protein